MSTIQEVAAYIGAADREEVDILVGLCRDRARAISKLAASINASLLKPGNKVRVTSGISPKYLIGATGVVEAGHAKPGTVLVKLDERVGKFSDGYAMMFPAACLEGVD